jgi:nitrate/nitrite-specific signal transduction histidine kinase
MQNQLLRIAQEAIHNAVRHANPTVVAVTLRCEASNLVLQVKDNGSGISAARLEKSEGCGLGNMRERASEIDGRLEIQTAAGHGTSITVTVPVSSFQPPAELGERTLRPLFCPIDKQGKPSAMAAKRLNVDFMWRE